MSTSTTRRTAIVTGSTSGIGLGIAHALAGAGYNIMLNGFGDAGEIESLRASLASTYGVEVCYCAADMGVASDIRALVSTTVSTLGSIDVLVNNAGIQHTSPLEDFPDEQWDRILAINLSAAFHSTKTALPHMKARGWGRVINIASTHGLVGSANKAAYVAAKHGLVGLTKVAAIETAQENTGVTVNAICPGWVCTPLVQAQIRTRAQCNDSTVEEETQRLVGEKQPLKRFTTPEQVGGLVVFLCSDAAETMTGGAVGIDGGWTAQ